MALGYITFFSMYRHLTHKHLSEAHCGTQTTMLIRFKCERLEYTCKAVTILIMPLAVLVIPKTTNRIIEMGFQ